MKKNEKLQELESLSFEKALEKLEGIVSKMESGKLPLEEMMKHFEEGSALSSICEKKLKELEKKIEILVKEDAQDGKWEEFSPKSGKNCTAADKTKSSASEKDTEETIEEEKEKKSEENTLF